MKVSVVIPLYNHAAYIDQAVTSVMNQTLPVHELIVVDDGSTDSSVSVMKNLCHRYPNIVFWCQPNQGAHQAMNSGVHRASGDLVAILNSDDVYHSERIEACVSKFLADPQTQVVATGIEFINDSKATNINSTWYALESMKKPTVWIVGGVDKGNDYSELFNLVKQNVKAIICIGIDNSKIYKAFREYESTIVDASSMEEAVKSAYFLAKDGDCVLLSPACASFDLFDNYEDRGRQFKKAVRNL